MAHNQINQNTQIYQPEIIPHQNKPIYDPFFTQCSINNQTSFMAIQQKLTSAKTLFDTDDYLESDEKFSQIKETQNFISSIEQQQQFVNLPIYLFHKSQTSIKQCIEDNKQNSSSNRSSRIDINEIYSTIQRRSIKYPETPNFKKLLRNNFPDFNKQFDYRFKHFLDQKDPSSKIQPIQPSCQPTKFLKRSYKFYLNIAQYFKKQQKIQQSIIFYKIACYLQPLDELNWEFSAKLQIDLGNIDYGLILYQVGLLSTKSESILQKYLKCFDKGTYNLKKLSGVSLHILEICNGKIQKYMRHLIQIALLYYKNFNQEKCFKILLYLYQNNQNNGFCLGQIVKILQIQKDYRTALIILGDYIKNNNVKHPHLLFMYIKYLQQYEKYQYIQEGYKLIENSLQITAAKDSKSKIYFDLSEGYYVLNKKQDFERCIKKALQCSKQPYRSKIYFAICHYKNIQIPLVKNTLVLLQKNKSEFIRSSQSKIILWNSNDWKHYLIYSLFYIFNNHQESYYFLHDYAKSKGYSGRIHCQLIWIQRVKLNTQKALKMWNQCIVQMPKSGQIWCQGGRMLMNKGQINQASKYFKIAIQLTPQYGDPFIQLLQIFIIQSRYQDIQKLKKKMIYSQPNYGLVWSYLKLTVKSSVIDIWRRAKTLINHKIYKHNIGILNKIMNKNSITAIDEFNELYFKQKSSLTTYEREKLYSLYDPFE